MAAVAVGPYRMALEVQGGFESVVAVNTNFNAWSERSELSYASAQDLLDWLEGQGVTSKEVRLVPTTGKFAVRWQG